MLDPASIASTIAKAAMVVLVTFSIPLQIHPCRASIDAVLKWRPKDTSRPSVRTSSPGGRPLLPGPAQSRSDHGSTSAISDLRFAILTTIILILAYIVALTVVSLERVLAYVGSTGSTSISFILPGLFYYKISDPNSIHQQRISKEDDDALSVPESDVEDADVDEGLLGRSVDSIHSLASGSSVKSKNTKFPWRWRRKWRWDMEHLNPEYLRGGALALAVYGVCVMAVCLAMNLVGTVTAH